EISEQLQEQNATAQQLELEHSERTQRGYAVSGEVEQNRQRLKEIEIEADRSLARQRGNEERCAELVVRVASAEAELSQARHRLAALESELDSNRQVLESAAADLTQLEWQQEEWRAAIMEAVASAADLRNQLTQAQERLAAVDRETQRLQAEIAAGSSQVEVFGGQRGQIGLEFETVSQRVAALTGEISQTRQ